MILTDAEIRQMIETDTVSIEPFKPSQIQPASYDLRVGAAGIATSSNSKTDIESKGFFELKPGDFAIIVTREVLQFDAQHTARIGLRSKYARKGIIATTGPQVDPGFHGRLKIGVTNLSPHVVAFPFEDDFITLEIHKLSRPSERPYSGPYQGIEDLSPDDIEVVTEGDNIGFAKMLDSLSALSRNVSELADTVTEFTQENKNIQKQNKFIGWVVGLGIAVIAIMVGIK